MFRSRKSQPPQPVTQTNNLFLGESVRRLTSLRNSRGANIRQLQSEGVSELENSIKFDFTQTESIQTENFLESQLKCRGKLRKQMARSSSRVTKELDIVKFIRRQRLNAFAVMSLLNGRQKFFVDHMSQLTMRESSNFEETSCDNELDNSYESRKNLVSAHMYTKGMLASSDQVDNRILDIYRIRKVKEIQKSLEKSSQWKNLAVHKILQPM